MTDFDLNLRFHVSRHMMPWLWSLKSDCLDFERHRRVQINGAVRGASRRDWC